MNAKLSWCLGWYDGPINGLAEWNGEKVYFTIAEDGGWTSYEPTADEIEAIEEEISGEGPETDIHWDDIDGKRDYYKCEDRTFNIYKLPAEILKTLESMHREFVKMVQSSDATEETRRVFYREHDSDERVETSKLQLLETNICIVHEC